MRSLLEMEVWIGNYEDMGKEHWNGNVDMDGLVSLEMD